MQTKVGIFCCCCFCLFCFFCVPQLYLCGSPLMGEIFAYVIVWGFFFFFLVWVFFGGGGGEGG